MEQIMVWFMGIVIAGVVFVLIVGLSGGSAEAGRVSKPQTPEQPSPSSSSKRPETVHTQTDEFWGAINKIVEEKTGTKLPPEKSIEEILAGMPVSERSKLLPVLLPVLVDAVREATGMDLDATLVQREFMHGKSLGMTQLDITIATDAEKMEKTLAGVKQYQEIFEHYQEELGDSPVVHLIKEIFVFRLLQETFKDSQLPPGWTPQRIAGLLSQKPLLEDFEKLPGEFLDGEVKDG